MESRGGPESQVHVAVEASRRLVRARRATLEQTLVERRRRLAADAAESLAEIVSDVPPGAPEGAQPA